MRKVEPTIKALFICLVCLFSYGVQAQEVKVKSNDLTVIEAKKNQVNQKQFDVPQTSQPFSPNTQAATSAQMQQVQAPGNTGLVKTSAQKTGLQGKANVVVDYNPEPVSLTLQQLQQIRLNNGRDNRIQPPMVDISQMKMSTDTCDGTVVFDDPSICSVAPNPGGNIDIVVDAFDCSFSSEEDNGDGTLNIYGLSVFVDPGGDSLYLGAVLESETFGTTACSTMPLMVPANMGCAPTMTEFVAVTGIFTVNSETGVISNFAVDTDCQPEYFTVTVNPNLTAQITDNGGDACGTLTAALFAEDGTQCEGTEATAVCIGPGDTPTITFNYPYPDPVDVNTYQECPEIQEVTGTPCLNCPCGGEVEYEDVTICSSGDEMIGVPIPEVSCMITPEVPNGENLFTIYSFDVYDADGNFLNSVYESATIGATACGSMFVDVPANNGCEAIEYAFTVETAINTLQIMEDTTIIVSFGPDAMCETAAFTVTVLPTLSAQVLDDLTTTAMCGTLTAGLVNAAGEVCEGSEEMVMCPMTPDADDNGSIISVEITNPYAECGGDAVTTFESGPCLACNCSGMAEYASSELCSEDADGDGLISVTTTVSNCMATPEIPLGDGILLITSFDIYQVFPDGTGNYLGSTFESATFTESACVDLTINFPVNESCGIDTFNFAIITALNTIDGSAATIGDGFIDFENDTLCAAAATFSVIVNPTLTVEVVDNSAECGLVTSSLVATDGTVCQMVSDSCLMTGNAIALTLDPIGCVIGDLTVMAECDNCIPPMASSDGCMCLPDGIDLDDDFINDLALVTITITSEEAGEGWTLSDPGTLLNPDATPTTAMVMDNSDGTYTITAYVAADNTTYNATFTNADGEVLAFDSGDMNGGGECNTCPNQDPEVPTVGEWGLIMLGLLMTITAVIGIRQRREDEVYA